MKTVPQIRTKDDRRIWIKWVSQENVVDVLARIVFECLATYNPSHMTFGMRMTKAAMTRFSLLYSNP